MGVLVGAVQHKSALAAPLTVTASLFVLLQILPPIQLAVSANLGDRTAAWLYGGICRACWDCRVWAIWRIPRWPKSQHGPRLRHRHHGASAVREHGFHRSGASRSARRRGLDCHPVRLSVVGRAPSGAAWLSTHWLLRESAIWKAATPMRFARPNARPTTPTGLPSRRSRQRRCGSSGLPSGRSSDSYRAGDCCLTCRTGRRDCASAQSSGRCSPVVGANLVVLYSLGNDAANGTISLSQTIVFAQAAIRPA